MERTMKIQMRLSPSEFSLIKDAALATGMSMSDYMRTTVLAGSQAIIEGDRERYERLLNSTARLIFAKMDIVQDT